MLSFSEKDCLSSLINSFIPDTGVQKVFRGFYQYAKKFKIHINFEGKWYDDPIPKYINISLQEGYTDLFHYYNRIVDSSWTNMRKFRNRWIISLEIPMFNKKRDSYSGK